MRDRTLMGLMTIIFLIGLAGGAVFTWAHFQAQPALTKVDCRASWHIAQMQKGEDFTVFLVGPDVRHEALTEGLLYHYIQRNGQPDTWVALIWKEYTDGKNIWTVPENLRGDWETVSWRVDVCWQGPYPGTQDSK